MTLRIIGIDLAVTAKHKAVVLNPATQAYIGGQYHFRARPDELAQLLKRAQVEAPADVQLVAIMEATGMAWYPVGLYLKQRGVTVYRVNGKKTKAFRQVLWDHTGSDLIDARVLAKLYLIAPERLTPWWPVTGQQLALQRACRAYGRYRDQDVALQNRLKAYDHWAWGNLQGLVPAAAQAWMRRHWYNPWQVAAADLSQLVDQWQTVAPDPTAATSWLTAWQARAHEMTQLYGSPAWVGYDDLQAIMRHALDCRDDYARQMDRLTQEQILPLYEKLYPDCPLTTIPGIGRFSAAVYRAFIQTIDRFATLAQFRRWCGMAPGSKQSGDFEAKGLPITKGGPNLVKASLYLNADVARQWDAQMAAIYHTQMVTYGKHHNQAICACASHLANRIFALLRHQRPYQLRDTHNRPITKQQSRELCQQLRVPDEIRRRNNKRFRRAKAQQKTEARWRKRQKRG